MRRPALRFIALLALIFELWVLWLMFNPNPTPSYRTVMRVWQEIEVDGRGWARPDDPEPGGTSIPAGR